MRTKLIGTVGLTLALFGAFQNCSSGSMPDTSTTASVASASNEMTFGTIYVTANPAQVNAGDTVVFNATMTNLTSATYVCATAAGAQLSNGILTPANLTFSLVASQALTCTFTGVGTNLVAPVSQIVNVGIIAAVAPTPTPVAIVAPPQTWTWQGLVYQTTCGKSGYCDGVEWASCAGTACAAPKIQCYNATMRGQSGHPAGTTQATQPTGYACYLRAANDPWIYR